MIDITPTLDIHEEEYECPLFVTNDFPSVDTMRVIRPIITAADSSLASTAAPQAQKPHSTAQFSADSAIDTAKIFLSVPIPTIEDIEDCKSFGVVLYSSPYWLLPTF